MGCSDLPTCATLFSILCCPYLVCEATVRHCWGCIYHAIHRAHAVCSGQDLLVRESAPLVFPCFVASAIFALSQHVPPLNWLGFAQRPGGVVVETHGNQVAG